ncbi:16S rRNA (uracil(1498)-N(3))-methyltransferase [Rubripirellula sp.]|jgi:16S rRNA (uracil1498-N3)-methyltransferase|nr:16S rRNA (uracil(1498)-N(3))-methyltransferase [Rubripirellula sp.]MDF1840154.1 RsmE family RNA methyltransferase [Rubripirellula sp.]
MTRRYFSPELPPAGGSVALSTEESQHAIRVMRLQIGDQVTLFDGNGSEAEAEVIDLGRNRCELQLQAVHLISREPSCEVEMAIALPKPDRARELIERLTELGVKSVTPVIAQRTQRPPSASLLQKLRRGVIEACKQCQRNQLLEVHDPRPSLEFFAEKQSGVCWIAHPAKSCQSIVAAGTLGKVTAAIGPEGGWTEEETVIAIENGYQTIDLGKRIYRIETAATVIASVLTMAGE